MDLSEFISKTLISIKQGVSAANKETGNSFKIQPDNKVVNFDVAVEISEEKHAEKGGGLKIHVVEAKMGGSTKTAESNISRISFTVGVNTSIS